MYPHTGTIKGLVSTEGGGSEYQSKGSSKCFLQPLRDEESSTFGSTFSQGYKCYWPLDTDIEPSDMVEIDDIDYTVRGISPRNYGRLKHTESLLEKK